ncbi:DNA repair helicase, putative [Perkinsus marinus ATCC 50983]|uniref:DNA 3'-5' helicase n=1 Tax=Perkinsus marinus (strain ATCC 50983 / TXsc) TaxID=423536 RepID=C5KM46_PERM5|nr:DNA repair helicase, putative [Perkinsus marinus ATCC 50983]EER14465.1 DNA repair helicase, putative [Perkinsus marinus ATCC 50983]|eukprot:XP_002782670.1 DNA repair helicase, putative [Perkinsus marinus ATCC 50983]
MAGFQALPPGVRLTASALKQQAAAAGGRSALRIYSNKSAAVNSGEVMNRPIPVIGETQDTATTQLMDLSGRMKLKPDHRDRPLWVCPDGRIIFEAGLHPDLFGPVTDFLVAIAEPISRPSWVHHFQITVFSLYAAISLGMSVEEVIADLDRFSKNEIDPVLLDYIQQSGSRIGKVRLVLRRNRYFVESSDLSLLRMIEDNSKIRKCKLGQIISSKCWSGWEGPRLGYHKNTREKHNPHFTSRIMYAVKNALSLATTAETNPGAANASTGDKMAAQVVHMFEINSADVETVKATAYREIRIPLLEEYDFRDDDDSNYINMQFRPTTIVRPYQERSLHKMFSGSRARSGMIVLPCGAGKTLVGITAAATMKKRTMVLTTTAVAVDQWKRQFELFCSISPDDVITLTAENKQPIPEDRPCILISTYSMFSVSYERMSRASKAVFESVTKLEWGLLVADEVQVMPAKTFRSVATTVRAHCKLGLTATLVREDELVEDLQYLIGPKLYEANWQELVNAGYLARVQCIEVWSEMPPLFWKAYLETNTYHVKRALYTSNTNKLMACEYLVALHESRGDKIIVFCDNVVLLKEMAQKTRKAFICGSVSMAERMACIRCFQHSDKINCIYLSQVGDNAIDIPNANVVIQISSHYGSRRQEAQRLGRILRPKAYRDDAGFNAYFYSLVSKDTPEKEYALKRQKYLVDQGYSFKVIADFDESVRKSGLKFAYSGPEAEQHVLEMALVAGGSGGESAREEEQNLSICDSKFTVTAEDEKQYLDRYTSLADLSGGGAGGGYYQPSGALP